MGEVGQKGIVFIDTAIHFVSKRFEGISALTNVLICPAIVAGALLQNLLVFGTDLIGGFEGVKNSFIFRCILSQFTLKPTSLFY